MEMIPTRKECLMLMERYGMLDNIVEHSLKVAKVALFISSELKKRGQAIDVPLVEASSLLHDITKTICLRTKQDHTRTGYDLLKGIGYERVGEVVGQHVWLEKRGDPSFVSEEEIVNYADKRVRHHEIVSLGDRFDDLKKRYGRNEEAIAYLDRMEKAVLDVEKKIFLILQIDPNDIGPLLGEEDKPASCIVRPGGNTSRGL
jgi:uncharacterized protein